MTTLWLAWLALLADPQVRFTFHKVGEVGSFAVQVTVADPTRAGTLQVTARDAPMLLVAPHQRTVDAKPAVFAGRYRGAGDLTITLRHQWRANGEVRSAALTLRAAFPEHTANDDVDGVELALAQAEAADARSVLEWAPEDSFSRYVVMRAHQSHDAQPAWRTPARTADLYDAFTGALAIQESLQLDEHLRADAREQPALELHALKPPKLESHPFDQMRGNREPEIGAALRYVPADFWCAQFASMESLLSLRDFGCEWGTHLLSMYGARAISQDVGQRYEAQLALRTDPLLRPFYGLAVADVVACGSDPFLNEGADLTLIFHLRSRTLFETRVRDLRSERAADCAIAPRTESIGGHDVHVVQSNDRAASSFLTWDAEHAIISNSRVALERVLAAHSDQARSLAVAPDFRYLMALAPIAITKPDGMLFLSEAFVRRVVGPELKIAEARRVRCVAELRWIENAALLYRTENGRCAATLADLVPGHLAENAVACPEHGSYSLENGHARCTAHGSLIGLTPCLELPVTKATKTEASDYDRFARRYNDYWRQYFDPVAVRFEIGRTARAETIILPLIDNSAYDSLKSWVGHVAAGPMPSAPATAILSLGGRIDARALLPSTTVLAALEREHGIALTPAAERAFAPDAQIFLGDGDLRLDFRIEQYLSGLLTGTGDSDLYLAPVLASISLPVAARVQVRDHAFAAEFVDKVRDAFVRESANTQILRSAPRFEAYALGSYRDVPVQVIAIEALAFRVRMFYALTRDALVIANQEAFLHETIDACLDQRPADTIAAHGRLEIVRSAWKQVTEPLMLAYAEAARAACLANLPIAAHVLQAAPGADAGTRRDLELRTFGRLGICPEGGAYSLADDGLATCSVHGSMQAQQQPRAPSADSALGHILHELHAMRVSLRFTPEGLASVLEIERG